MSSITITIAGRNMYRDSMSGANNPFMSFVAFGTDGTAPTTADTVLNNEVFRKSITSYANGVDGELLINVYISPADLVGINIAEVGFIGGKTASGDANTGILLAHGLYSHAKSNLEAIQFQLDFNIL